MAMENWNDFSETVVNYVETLTAPDDKFTADMAKNFIVQGTNDPRQQVRLSRTIKDILSQFEDSPLNGRRASSRASGVARLSDELQALWAETVQMITHDGITTITLGEDAYEYHTTFSGRKDENNEPLTSWGSNENMVAHTLMTKLEAGFVSAHKGDN
tara:strand:+ start:1072 stop:1545 length:474 start_codon:yes stop_codon:yes gene_type:complete